MTEEKFIDYHQCAKVVKVLDDYFKSIDEIASVEYPKNILYKSNEYFLYMFYSCLLDYGMRSKIYHKNLANTYEKNPKIFDPKYVINMEIEELKNIIINNIHPRYPNIAVSKWLELSKELSCYDNILDYLKDINSFEKLESFIRGIKGYGQKTGGLLIRIITDTKVCNFNENVDSIPIDRHDIEISFLTGIIADKQIGNRTIKELSDTYVRISKDLDINPSDVDKYLWELGSSFCNSKRCSECPLSNCCKVDKRKI